MHLSIAYFILFMPQEDLTIKNIVRRLELEYKAKNVERFASFWYSQIDSLLPGIAPDQAEQLAVSLYGYFGSWRWGWDLDRVFKSPKPIHGDLKGFEEIFNDISGELMTKAYACTRNFLQSEAQKLGYASYEPSNYTFGKGFYSHLQSFAHKIKSLIR